MTLVFNPEKMGLSKVFRDYQEEAVRFIWEVGKRGAISKEVWTHVNETLVEKTISRASIINFLNAMVDEGIFNLRLETGKGGYHGVYTAKLDEFSFKQYLVEIVLTSLMEDFPEETMAVIEIGVENRTRFMRANK